MGDMTVNIDGMLCTPLNVIRGDLGDVYHALKVTDEGYSGFGEAYFSTVAQGAIKGWKRHKQMTLNLVVPVGEVRFVVFDDRAGFESRGTFVDLTISPSNYRRLTLPPGLWFGFMGIAAGPNLVMNVASIPHDPAEVEQKALASITFDWQRQ